MTRCITLAELASGDVAPNPLVGAVLVHDNTIIGEGYHKVYGGPHAEVNCIASVKEVHRQLIPKSILYVSLEPCAHWGKTPPCADLIIRNKIQKVIVGCSDSFAEVNGKGIERLKHAGVEVQCGILEKECRELNKRFFLFHEKRRPYVVLKWAETLDKKIANADRSRLFISNQCSGRLVHKWRSEEASIVVGTNTAFHDDPQLTTRLWPGKNALRVVVDMHLRLPATLKLFDGSVPTIIFNGLRHQLSLEKETGRLTGVNYYCLPGNDDFIHGLLSALYQLNVQSVLVEGGSQLLQSFIDAGLWNEARVITNPQLVAGEGLASPQLNQSPMVRSQDICGDVIRFYENTNR